MENDPTQEGYRQTPPMTAEIVPSAQTPQPRRRPRIFTILLILFLLFLLGGSILTNMVLLAGAGVNEEARVREIYFSHERLSPNKIAIISVEGTILDGEKFVRRQITRALKDDKVRAVVLRVNSPGGTVAGADEIYHRLNQLTQKRDIPLVVSMGAVAASGGYYVSMAVGDTSDSIFAEPATWTGSIGVIIPHFDLSTMLNRWGIAEDSVSSHRLKGMGSFAKPMTEEERKIWQGLVNDSFDRFKSIVRDGLPSFAEDPEALDKLATGQIFSATQALEKGLIDQIGYLDDAVARAIELTGLDEKEVRVVRYKRELSLLDILIGSESQAQLSSLKTFFDLTSPRAYYLSTSLPSLISSRP